MTRPVVPFDLDSWITQYGDRLLRFAWSYVQDPDLAEDIVQETFLRLWQAATTNPQGIFRAGWLYTVARRLAIDAYRARQREAPEIPRYPPSPDPAIALSQAEAIEAILDALPDLDREVLFLFYYHEWSVLILLAMIASARVPSERALCAPAIGFELSGALPKKRRISHEPPDPTICFRSTMARRTTTMGAPPPASVADPTAPSERADPPPAPHPPGDHATHWGRWTWAAVVGAVAAGVGAWLGGPWRSGPPLPGAATAFAAVAPGAPYRLQHLWTLTVPPAATSAIRVGRLTLPRNTALTPMALAQLMGTIPTGAWIVPRGGPVLWHWTPQGPLALPVPAAAATLGTDDTLLVSSQRADGHSALVTVQGNRVTAHAWPIPAPAVWGPGFGATSGLAASPHGTVWIAGGIPVTAGAPSVPAPHGILAPLFHPIVARVRPNGQLLQATVLRGLTVGAVTALTRASDGSLWFGINTGPYDRTDALFRGRPLLVHWDPHTHRLQRYAVPAADGAQAIIDQLVVQGSQVWLTLQHSPDGTDWGRPETVWRFDCTTGQWHAMPLGGAVFAWAVTPAGAVLAVVQQDGPPPQTVVTLGGHPVARAYPGATIAGVGIQGSTVWALLVPVNPNPREPVPVQVVAFRPTGAPLPTPQHSRPGAPPGDIAHRTGDQDFDQAAV